MFSGRREEDKQLRSQCHCAALQSVWTVLTCDDVSLLCMLLILIYIGLCDYSSWHQQDQLRHCMCDTVVSWCECMYSSERSIKSTVTRILDWPEMWRNAMEEGISVKVNVRLPTICLRMSSGKKWSHVLTMGQTQVKLSNFHQWPSCCLFILLPDELASAQG